MEFVKQKFFFFLMGSCLWRNKCISFSLGAGISNLFVFKILMVCDSYCSCIYQFFCRLLLGKLQVQDWLL